MPASFLLSHCHSLPLPLFVSSSDLQSLLCFLARFLFVLASSRRDTPVCGREAVHGPGYFHPPALRRLCRGLMRMVIFLLLCLFFFSFLCLLLLFVLSLCHSLCLLLSPFLVKPCMVIAAFILAMMTVRALLTVVISWFVDLLMFLGLPGCTNVGCHQGLSFLLS